MILSKIFRQSLYTKNLFKSIPVCKYKQRLLGGYNVPPFCGITRVFSNYYGMVISHKLLN